MFDIGLERLALEFERGKTITNNMNLYDLWKSHLSEKSGLILVVPYYVRGWVFPIVIKRIHPFFEQPNKYIDVSAVAIVAIDRFDELLMGLEPGSFECRKLMIGLIFSGFLNAAFQGC